MDQGELQSRNSFVVLVRLRSEERMDEEFWMATEERQSGPEMADVKNVAYVAEPLLMALYVETLKR